MAVGDVVMVRIADILTTWKSVDGDCYCWDTDEPCSWCEDRSMAWDSLLDGKREDCQYDEVVESLQSKGFLRPSTFYLNDEGTPVHGDGHHRLAAAIDLGLTHLPYEQRRNYSDKLISNDSGDWYSDSPVYRSVEGAWHATGEAA